jgi:hypothetical protein
MFPYKNNLLMLEKQARSAVYSEKPAIETSGVLNINIPSSFQKKHRLTKVNQNESTYETIQQPDLPSSFD